MSYFGLHFLISVPTKSDFNVYLVPTVPWLEFKGPLEETMKVLYLFMERNRYGVLLCSATQLSLLKYFYDVRDTVGLL